MKRFYGKVSLLLFPLVMWIAVELFILPADFFTFRHWEAVRVVYAGSLPGPFYPNYQNIKMSYGDRATKTSQPKKIEFITDQYGFRNREFIPDHTYDYVLIGDSNIAGSNLDQKNTLAEVLADLCHCSTYNYGSGAPYHIISYVNDIRFKKYPPKNVVLEIRGGDLEWQNIVDVNQCVVDTDNLTNLRRRTCTDHLAGRFERLFEDNVQALIWLDRLQKFPSFQKFKSAARIAKTKAPEATVPVFDHASAAEMRLRFHVFNNIVRERGSQLILYVMPTANRQFDDFLRMLEADGIPVVFSFPTKEQPDGEDQAKWWAEDDTHWREASVVKAAHMIYERAHSLNKTFKVGSK